MKQLFQGDLTKILLYFILTLTATAALAPWLYNAGKMISEVAESRHTSEAAQGIAGWCARAEFAHYFLISFLGCALVLAGPFICWMRIGSGEQRVPVRPWSLRLRHSAHSESGQPLASSPSRVFQWTTGFLLAGSLLVLMNWLFLLTGWFSFDRPVHWLPSLARSLGIAIVLATVFEWVFRGALLGILLRSLRPTLAVVGVSVIYACLHFLFLQKTFHLTHAGDPDAGFRFLIETGKHLSSHLDHTFGFIALLFTGLILAYARYRTASLSLSIGLQTGWLFVYFLSREIIDFTSIHSPNMSVIIGTDRRSGLIPLCILIATGLLIHVFIQITSQQKKANLTTPSL